MGLLDNPIVSNVISTIKGNPIATALGAGAVVGSAGLVTTAIVKSKRKKSVKRKSSRKKNPSRRSRRSKRRCSGARTAGKNKDRSTKRIRITKNGQPYIILKSGKARFIKKSSCRRSKKLKGGRY